MKLILILLLLSSPIMADENKTFRWTNPVLNTDGSPYDAALDQSGSRVYCNVDPVNFIPQEPGIPQTYPVTSNAQFSGQSTTELLQDGNYTCFATVVNNNGVESHPSNLITFTIGVVGVIRPEPPILR